MIREIEKIFILIDILSFLKSLVSFQNAKKKPSTSRKQLQTDGHFDPIKFTINLIYEEVAVCLSVFFLGKRRGSTQKR